ncbi:MAG TPA: tetratricopeptide repeat protein, partial [Gemmatimonadales bacterium]
MVLLAACGRELPKEDLDTARTRGLVFLAQDQLAEAEAEFRTVIALAPEDPLGYANLGLVHLRAGRLRDAEKALRKALDRDSTDIAPVLSLATVLDLTGRRAEARALLERHVGPP